MHTFRVCKLPTRITATRLSGSQVFATSNTALRHRQLKDIKLGKIRDVVNAVHKCIAVPNLTDRNDVIDIRKRKHR